MHSTETGKTLIASWNCCLYTGVAVRDQSRSKRIDDMEGALFEALPLWVHAL